MGVFLLYIIKKGIAAENSCPSECCTSEILQVLLLKHTCNLVWKMEPWWVARLQLNLLAVALTVILSKWVLLKKYAIC